MRLERKDLLRETWEMMIERADEMIEDVKLRLEG